MRRLQAQTLPDATPPLGKILLFTKKAITFEPTKLFRYLQDLESPKKCGLSMFYD